MTVKRDRVKERCDRAIEAFKDHELVDCREDRWRICKREPDGTLTNIHAAEIVSLWGGRIYVGGDIHDCTFAYYSDHTNDHLAKLRWMGCHTDVGYYVRQKATIGMSDGGKLVDDYDEDEAIADLDFYEKQYMEDLDARDLSSKDLEKAKENLRSVFVEAKTMLDDPDAMRRYLYGALDDADAWEWLGELGLVVSWRVVYAWAALRRLCELLEAKAT